MIASKSIASKSIAVAHPVLAGNERKYVLECIDTGWISSIGKFIGLFEDAFAAYCGAKYAVACNNGTSALHLALEALGIGPGDEVIVPTLTYVASANAVRYCGAEPVFVDSEASTMTLDPALLASKITKRTKAIMAVHLYGHPADMAAISQIAKKHNLFVVEDAAEAHGALCHNRMAGSIGDVATFSFYGNKIMTTGEGGMVTTSDPALRDKIRLLRGQGMDPKRRYWFPVVGYNYRMTNIAAAIGLAQLEQIDEFLAKRAEIAEAYKEHLTPLEASLILPTEQAWAKHAFWSYTVILRDRVRLGRDAVMALLEADGIETRPGFPPMHTLPPYHEDNASYPVADMLSSRGIVLPMHGLLTTEDVRYIADRLAHHCVKFAASA